MVLRTFLNDGKLVQIGGEWYDEKELREEWKNNPESHESNCYFTADITPQKVEKVYTDSLKG